eukprot:g63287.t1
MTLPSDSATKRPTKRRIKTRMKFLTTLTLTLLSKDRCQLLLDGPADNKDRQPLLSDRRHKHPPVRTKATPSRHHLIRSLPPARTLTRAISRNKTVLDASRPSTRATDGKQGQTPCSRHPSASLQPPRSTKISNRPATRRLHGLSKESEGALDQSSSAASSSSATSSSSSSSSSSTGSLSSSFSSPVVPANIPRTAPTSPPASACPAGV